MFEWDRVCMVVVLLCIGGELETVVGVVVETPVVLVVVEIVRMVGQTMADTKVVRRIVVAAIVGAVVVIFDNVFDIRILSSHVIACVLVFFWSVFLLSDVWVAESPLQFVFAFVQSLGGSAFVQFFGAVVVAFAPVVVFLVIAEFFLVSVP